MNITGMDKVLVPEHVIFVVLSEVITFDNWGGDVASNHWLPGDLALLPAGTTLRSRPLCAYGENMIRICHHLFESAAISADLDVWSIGLRYMKIRNVQSTMAAFAAQGAMFMGERAGPLAIEQAAVCLSEQILREASSALSARLDKLHSGLSDARRRRVVEYIAENFRHPIGLSDLAGVAALSQHHFCRSFMKEFGTTPMQYVAKRRIEAAKRLLLSSLPLAEVATECGYSSQSHMNAVFKKTLGVTPGGYRSGIVAALIAWFVDWVGMLEPVAGMA